MKCLHTMALALAAMAALAVSQASAQVLANPGFEDPLVNSGSAIGAWFSFSGGAGASSENNNVDPRSGALHLDLTINNVNNSFAGVFQDVPGVSPGSTVNFSVWHKTPSNPLDLGAEVRIEWRSDTAEVGRTPNSVPIPTSDYTQFTLSAAAPAGTTTARLVYAIQTFGAEPTNTGTVYVDDASISVVPIPEPATIALLGLGAIGLAGLRRRRA